MKQLAAFCLTTVAIFAVCFRAKCDFWLLHLSAMLISAMNAQMLHLNQYVQGYVKKWVVTKQMQVIAMNSGALCGYERKCGDPECTYSVCTGCPIAELIDEKGIGTREELLLVLDEMYGDNND